MLSYHRGHSMDKFNDSCICQDRLASAISVIHKRKTFSRSVFVPAVSWLCLLLITATALSIPWEFIRLYQKAVAERASKIIEGVPSECSYQTMTWYEAFKSLLRLHFSWSHSQDPCHDYHYALLVDPLWEVTPLMVLSSVFVRCLFHPLELACSSLGRSIRSFFSEIPVQWQPLLLFVGTVALLLTLLMVCRYRLSFPMLLRIEPRSPVSSTAFVKNRGCSQNSVSERQKLDTTRDFTALKNTEYQNSDLSCTLVQNDYLNRLKNGSGHFHRYLHSPSTENDYTNGIKSRRDCFQGDHMPKQKASIPNSLMRNCAFSGKPTPKGFEYMPSDETLPIGRMKYTSPKEKNPKAKTKHSTSSDKWGSKRHAVSNKKKKSHCDPSWIPNGEEIYVVSDSD